MEKKDYWKIKIKESREEGKIQTGRRQRERLTKWKREKTRREEKERM